MAVFISSACMLIGNNNQPLGCAFECDIFITNFTYVCNHEKGYHGARITSLNVSFLIFGTLIIGLFIYSCNIASKLESAISSGEKTLIEMDSNKAFSVVQAS